MIIPVKENGVRPAGKKDRCFYCGQKVSEDNEHHKFDCVCRKRSVVVEARITYVVHVPAHWDSHMIEFHENDSSFCIGNDIQNLAEWGEAEGRCACGSVEVKFLREAAEADVDTLPHAVPEES